MGNSPPRSPKRRQAWPQTVIEIPSGTKVARRRAVPTAPVPSLPNEPRFAPSFNGRNGWRFEKVYNVGDALGRGSFGTVFVGTHRFAHATTFDENGDSFAPEWKRVAIKKTQPNLLDLKGGQVFRTYDDFEDRCQEIKALIRLQEGSPRTSNVLYLYEYFKSGKDVYLITEVLGQELEDWKSECDVFTERMAIDICRTILQGIDFCSSRGVVHRDIKMQNVLFRVNGDFRTLKLVDFGLARVLERDEEVRDYCGSIGYIAPEIYSKEWYRFEVDMFAFGVLLFRLLSGNRPFPINNYQILERHTVDLRYDVQGQDWENVSPAAKDLVRKLLINQKERLTADQALDHPWFSEAGASVLQVDRTVDSGANSTRAFVRESGNHVDGAFGDFHSSCSVPSNNAREENGSRFWMDSSVEIALATIISLDIYSARVVDLNFASGESSAGMICIEETTFPTVYTFPQYVTQLQSYSEKDCRSICRELAQCIKILHTAGLAHRNLNLGNVFIDPLGKVRLRGLQHVQPIRENHPMTGHFGYLYNLYAFKAPEIDSEFVHDKSVDLWSFGVILYVLLTGVPPFRGDGMMLVEAKRTGQFEFDIGVPSDEAQRLVRSLLQVEPFHRFTIDDVLASEWMNGADNDLARLDLDTAFVGLKYFL